MDDEENVEALVEERIDGEEIAGKEGMEMGSNELFSSERRFDFPFPPEILDDGSDGFLVKGNAEF
jgi:hypothetical protein